MLLQGNSQILWSTLSVLDERTDLYILNFLACNGFSFIFFLKGGELYIYSTVWAGRSRPPPVKWIGMSAMQKEWRGLCANTVCFVYSTDIFVFYTSISEETNDTSWYRAWNELREMTKHPNKFIQFCLSLPEVSGTSYVAQLWCEQEGTFVTFPVFPYFFVMSK